MKIATFNINDVNKRLANLLDWLAEAKPDVVCLQELKADQGRFRRLRCAMPGMRWLGKGSGHGMESPS